MSDVNEEMKSTAYFAIKSAKERFGQTLDYSTQSVVRLENLLGHIYWGFSNHTKDDGENGVIFNTAIIWGSYLGEYMRLIWGGKWVVKGGVDPIISIDNIEFSPISMVYQKITNQPDYSIEDYLTEAKRTIDSAESNRTIDAAESKKTIDAAVVKPQQPQSMAEDIRELQAEIPSFQEDKPRLFNKRLLFSLAGIGGILFVTLAIIIGYKIITAGGSSANGVIPSPTSSGPTGTLGVTAAIIAPITSETQTPTVTLFPTYTPRPSATPVSSKTPNLTETLVAAFTPTGTQTPLPPTPTRTPTRTRTPVTPTDTHIPQTEAPPATITPRPTSTATETPPSIVSCDVNPTTVGAGRTDPLTFTVQFSAPGYGISVYNNDPQYPGETQCSDNNGDGDATASCQALSEMLLSGIQLNVTINTPIGNCTVFYRAQ